MPDDRLSGLLSELKRGETTLERLRTVALEWRTLRELGKAERKQLAIAMGFEGAEHLLERLASRKGGIAPRELLEAVHAARQADPTKLEELLASLKHPAERGQVVAQGLDALAQHLATAAPGQPTRQEPTQQPALAHVSPPPSAPASAPPPTLPSVTPKPAPVAAEPAPIVPTALDPGRRPPPPSASRWTMRPAARPSVSPAPEPAPGGLIERVSGEKSPLRRLHLLRSSRQELAALDLPSLRKLLGQLPSGWQRRRALATLLADDVPALAADALELVRELDTERDRTWCLGVLLDRPLTQEERRAALELVGSRAARRRLERRGLPS